MKIYLIPSLLSEETVHLLSPYTKEIVSQTTHYLVENIRTARRFISAMDAGVNIRELKFFVLDKKTKYGSVERYLRNLPSNTSVGVISEAGCPGVADPGALAVQVAHQYGWEVVPVPGPSSILLALMGSGMNGQCFTFQGYLPVDKNKRKSVLQRLENESAKKSVTQIFMETPYRNNHLFEDVLESCSTGTRLCVAANLTAPDQFIRTLTVGEWKKKKPDLHKKPTIFLLMA
ncbi:SAM-dependent methyltransferase [Rapidithrix thailandica]|uniref:SAM-dependent methyltransferase n=1 Tax=Rapidithrix thailandica TaxID=413964 RepID=A0AAW9SBF7_9BACT